MKLFKVHRNVNTHMYESVSTPFAGRNLFDYSYTELLGIFGIDCTQTTRGLNHNTGSSWPHNHLLVTVNDSKSKLAATAEQPVNTSLVRHVTTLCDGEPGTC